MTSISLADVTGLVLAGGRGSRMGGVDKGLQKFNGMPLAACAASRLAAQVGQVALNANRNIPVYEAFGWPVWPDRSSDHAGPLEGFLTGMAHCGTAYLLTVPCDTPLFPLDLARRLADAMSKTDADIAMASAADAAGATEGPLPLRPQPVFSLLRLKSSVDPHVDSGAGVHADLHSSLQRFLQEGGRKVGAWTALHRTVRVPFDLRGDAPDAFLNANTLDELHALETR
jgi:molybdopterin-guanine dinucleotide biosynthesis protein A